LSRLTQIKWTKYFNALPFGKISNTTRVILSFPNPFAIIFLTLALLASH
jgi:hypothetical protein